jgi:hypothetical protein
MTCIALFGGTGRIGQHVLAELPRANRRCEILARADRYGEQVGLWSACPPDSRRAAAKSTLKSPLTLPGGTSSAAGKTYSMSGVSIIRLRNGKVVEEDAWADWRSIAQ